MMGPVHCVSPAVLLVLCIVIVALTLSQSSRCVQVLAPVLGNDPSFGDGVFTDVIS